MRRFPLLAALTCLTVLLSVPACDSDDTDTEPPSTPTGLTADAGSATSVHVMWEAARDNVAVTAYQVYLSGRRVRQVPADRHMVDVTGLEPGARYRFAVRAVDAAGNVSAHGAERPVTMPSADRDDHRAPTRPTGLRGRAEGARAAVLTWRPSTDNLGVSSYDIYQGDSRVHSVGGDRSTARVTGLRPGTDYAFTVRARDTADNLSPASNTVELTTPSVPGDGSATAPTAFRVRSHTEHGAHYLDLSWLPPETEEDVTEYQIHLNGRLASTLVWGDAAPPGRADYSLPVEAEGAGTRYTVRIRGRLPDGEWGRFSAERTVTLAGPS